MLGDSKAACRIVRVLLAQVKFNSSSSSSSSTNEI